MCCVCVLNWIDKNQTEALSESCMCCLLLGDANHSELCLTLFDTWLEKEEDNFPDGSKSSYFSILKTTLLSNTIELAQFCTLGLNCVVVKAKFFLWGWSPICGWAQVKGLRDSDTSSFYIILFKHSSPGTIPLTVAFRTLSHLSDFSWWLFISQTTKTRFILEADVSVAVVLPISGPWIVQN